MSSTGVHERETDDVEQQRLAKRAKTDKETVSTTFQPSVLTKEMEVPTDAHTEFPSDDLLPPSRSLLPHKRSGDIKTNEFRISEPDVGITEYISHDVRRIEGIIKQRFTDFLVYEVDIQGEVVHLKEIEEPPIRGTDIEEALDAQDPSIYSSAAVSLEHQKYKPSQDERPAMNLQDASPETARVIMTAEGEKPTTPDTTAEENVSWPHKFTEALVPLLPSIAIEQLKEMFLQGPEPPFIRDNGWSRQPPTDGADTDVTAETFNWEVDGPQPAPEEKTSRGKKGKEKDGRTRGKGSRGTRGTPGGRANGREDPRKVLSDPIGSKQERTALHEVIRTLFRGKLETETYRSAAGSDSEQRIIIKWSKAKGGNVKRGNKDDAVARGGRRNPFPYIHFTMQKTNRDTQDALSHLSRLLHVNVKDLSVSGTKDKRGVTMQRVSFKRNSKTIQDVWKTVNGISSRRSVQQAIRQRGERGIRIGDLAYRKSFLELGMLRGNAFVITLRNVKVDSEETMNRALESLKEHGFINYYGMQRFGTASIPTHSIGLALLRSDWTGAVSLILRPRPGEYPEAEAARRAWLEEKDLDKALSLMPRRVVAERCILESYQKQGGDDRNALGAISTIPKNLRLMYVHAYQSYVWNAIVSERVKEYGRKPIVGDLVFNISKSAEDDEGATALSDAEGDEVNVQVTVDDDLTGSLEGEKENPSLRKERRSWRPPRIKVLSADDLDKYSIFDVIMPLPGTDVAYPEGPLGEKYREFLRLDGLDPDNFNRKQRDYTLGGSYRKILHLPKHLSWSTMRYTDPDVALAQSDEDQLLGFDPPMTNQTGPFLALQIRFQLGTAAYATMALREITKTETSSHHQSALTLASDDQKFRGTGESALMVM
ncbi:pseudouridine synthase [Ramaria rubella]|nr:pseudouridine synthase [Ramaria rubella]